MCDISPIRRSVISRQRNVPLFIALYYCIYFATFYAKAKGIVTEILDLNSYLKFGPRSRAHLWAGSFALLELTSLVLYYSIRA